MISIIAPLRFKLKQNEPLTMVNNFKKWRRKYESNISNSIW